MAQIIGYTESVCPQCLQRIKASRVVKEDGIYLEKVCPEHGAFSTLIWHGDAESYYRWGAHQQAAVQADLLPQRAVTEQGCPYDCGLCAEHKQQMCCVLLELTSRCDLHCSVCFAAAGTETTDPTLAEISRWLEALLAAGGPFNIQLSGGEATLRDDLPEIIALGKEKGFPFFQLNTNGLRLARDGAYVRRLAEAGLDTVFLQFDGVSERPYQKLRGRALLAEKMQAIAQCAANGLGVVLVPTVVAGVNDQELGRIIDFALSNMPAVRGVHFQPVSYFGRMELEKRQHLTIPDMLAAIEEQTGGRMRAADFAGGSAENAYCSFHGNFMQMPDGTLSALTKTPACSCAASSQQSRQAVAKRWTFPQPMDRSKNEPQDAFDVFLNRFEQQTLAMSGMLFQDAWNLDLERLKRCYIGEVDGRGGIIPFCAYNLTSQAGRSLYRKKA